MRGQFVPSAFEEFQRATGVGRINSTGKKPPGLHHLMAGIMDGRGSMITGSDQRKLISQFGLQREDFGNLNVRIIGPDGLERSPDFARRVRFHVPGVELAGSAQIENQNDRFLVVALSDGAQRFESGQVRESKPKGAEGADLEEVAPRDAIAGRDGAGTGYFQHNFTVTGFAHTLVPAGEADNRQNRGGILPACVREWGGDLVPAFGQQHGVLRAHRPRPWWLKIFSSRWGSSVFGQFRVAIVAVEARLRAFVKLREPASRHHKDARVCTSAE